VGDSEEAAITAHQIKDVHAQLASSSKRRPATAPAASHIHPFQGKAPLVKFASGLGKSTASGDHKTREAYESAGFWLPASLMGTLVGR